MKTLAMNGSRSEDCYKKCVGGAFFFLHEDGDRASPQNKLHLELSFCCFWLI
jgi:hypothetical protein